MGTTFSKLCKQFISVSVFLLLFSSLVFSQYYVDQDKIDLARQTQKYYDIDKSLIQQNDIYLNHISQRGYVPNVNISFDKLKYAPEDTIIITFNFSKGSESDSELVGIIANAEIVVNNSNLRIEKNSYVYFFTLRDAETRIGFVFKERPYIKNLKSNRLDISFGSIPKGRESLQYVFNYETTLNNENDRNNETIKNKDNGLSPNCSIAGKVIDGTSNKPINQAFVFLKEFPWWSDNTDEKGDFCINNILPGFFTAVCISQNYHKDKVINIQLCPDSVSRVEFYLTPSLIPEEPLNRIWSKNFIPGTCR